MVHILHGFKNAFAVKTRFFGSELQQGTADINGIRAEPFGSNKAIKIPGRGKKFRLSIHGDFMQRGAFARAALS